MSGDERVQIYVPSPQVGTRGCRNKKSLKNEIYSPSPLFPPQSTPYSTISKAAADSHKSITFLSYQPDSLASQSASSTTSHLEERTDTTVVASSHQEVEATTTILPAGGEKREEVQVRRGVRGS